MSRLALLLAPALLLAGCLDDGALDAASVSPAATPLVADLAPYAPVQQLRAAIDASLAASAPVEILAAAEVDTLGRGALAAPATFKVVLQPSQVLNASAWAEVDGQRVAFPRVWAYEGTVEGRPDQPVRLTVTDEWARGTVRVGDLQYLVRMGLQGNLPHYVPVGDAPGNATAMRASDGWAPQGAPFTLYDKDGLEPEDCLALVPPHVKPMVDPVGSKSTASPLVARLVMDGDAHYAHQLGPHAFPMLVAFLNEVDSIYEYEVGIRFQLVGLHLNTDPEYYPDPADHAPLAELKEYWDARTDVPRDIVHIVTGQPSSYAQANCIGGAGFPDTGYSFTPLNWARQYVVFHEQAFAHELGHLFSAHHHYGNHVEASWGGTTRPAGMDVKQAGAGLATIMIQGYTPGAKPVFGSVEKSVIRGYAESHLGKHDG